MLITRTNIAICAAHKKLTFTQLEQLGFKVDGHTLMSTVLKNECQVCRSLGATPVVLEGELMQGGNGVKAKEVNKPPTKERRKTAGRTPPQAETDALIAAKARLKAREAGKHSILIDIALTNEDGEVVDRYIKVYKAKSTSANNTFKMVKAALDSAGTNMQNEG